MDVSNRKPRGPNKNPKPACKICGEPQIAKKLCPLHYGRLLRTGSLDKKSFYHPMTNVSQTMTPIQIAWLAGIVDGEGCFNKQGGSFCLSVSSTDYDIVEKCQLITEIGSIKQLKDRPNRKSTWTWRVFTTADTVRLALAMAPLLCSRRKEKILEILEEMDPKKKRI